MPVILSHSPRLVWTRKVPLAVVLLVIGLYSGCSGQLASLSPGSEDLPVTSGSEVALPGLPTGVDSPGNTTLPARNIRFEHINVEEGLSHSVIRCILQDRQGFMWFGTEDGLNRYDGRSFITFRPDPDDFYSLNDIWINTLFEDSQGNLWIGTRQGGLNRYDPLSGNFSHYIHDPLVQNSLSGNTVNAIQEDNNGYLWIGTDQGLDRYDPALDTFKHYYITPPGIDAPLDDQITSIYKASNGILWIGTAENGLKRFHPVTGSFRIYTHDPSSNNTISNNHVNAITEDRNGSLWIATQDGLNLFDWKTEIFFRFRHSSSPISIANNTVYSLHIDRQGNLWVGTSDGLDFFVRQTRTFMHYQHDPGSRSSLSNDTILAIHEDRGGILWFGTFGGSLNVYDRVQDRFQYYYNSNAPGSLSGNNVFPIHAAPDGSVWVGTYGEGLNHFDPLSGVFTVFKNEPENPASLQNNEIWALWVDHAGQVWVGTSTGLDRLDPLTGRCEHYRNIPGAPTSLTRGQVRAIYEDSQQRLWVGTQFGLNLYDPSTGLFTRLNHIAGDSSSISQDDITAIMEDLYGRLWVGTALGGLNRLDHNTGLFTSYSNDPQDRISIGNNSILGIYQDSHRTIWIGTAGGGLSRYDFETDTFDNFTTNDGLPNDVVYGVLEAENGFLWLSTNEGLSALDPGLMTFYNFSVNDGLQGNQFNANAYARTPSGEMYFGGVNGLTVFMPFEISPSTYVPPVVLLSFKQGGDALVSDVPVEQIQAITIRWPDTSFDFEYIALSYSQSQESQYAYMLENFDEDWFYAGTERNGRYTNLPGGDYVLRLKAANSDGIWDDEGIGIQIRVVPPFWQTALFRGLVGLLLLGLAVLVYQVRVKSVQARSHELERLVRSRTTALEKRGQEMEALYSADGRMLRTQTLEQVYQTLVDVAEEMLSADKSAVLTWDEKQTRLAVRVSRGFKAATVQKLRFARGEGTIGRVAETGQPMIIANLAVDANLALLAPEVRSAILDEGISSFLHLPIAIDNRVVGVFIVGFTRPETFNEDTVRLFSALVQRAALSVENAILFEQTKELAIVEERNRLARDLHDSAKQKAFAALAQVGAANGLLKTSQPNVRKHLEEAENLVYEVIQELTFLIQEIHPSALKEKGLAAMLREYVYQWESRNDAGVSLKIENDRRLSLNVEQAFYRIIQEALANITRHSKATHVSVHLAYGEAEIEALVVDDGCGFNCDQVSSGLGLRSIMERIESIHGTCQIDSAPGQGCRLMARAPLEIIEKEEET